MIMKKVLLLVPNMTCTKCVNLISKVLTLTEGVGQFKVRLKFKTIILEYDENVISVKDIMSKLKEKGYGCMITK